MRTAGRRISFPNLDGLRFFAFFSVFLFHSFYTNQPAIVNHPVYGWFYRATRDGHLGVNLFFVLSGFLITYLLLSEKELRGNIGIGAFYMRRILRIWPLYYLIVFIGFVVFPILKSKLGSSGFVETADIRLFLVFLANFNNIWHESKTPMLHLLWSVSIEEQFYLLWPVLVAIVPIHRMAWLFATIVAISVAFRIMNVNNLIVLDSHTASVISDMAIGGLFAWLVYTNTSFLNWWTKLPKGMIIGFYVLGFAFIYIRSYIIQAMPYYISVDRVVLAVFFAFIIMEQCFSEHSVFKLMRWKFVSHWGTYTYGLYCWHFLALLIAYQINHRLGLNNNVWGVVVLDNILALAVALLISWLSYNVYEKPFLRLKDRFAYIKR